jgi:hypothetical protein
MQFFLAVSAGPLVLYFPPLLLGLLAYLPSYLDGSVPCCEGAEWGGVCWGGVGCAGVGRGG